MEPNTNQTQPTNVVQPDQPSNGTTQVPDAATVRRIEDLGAVGTALEEWSNGRKYDDTILQAKQSLKSFHEGINKLELSVPSKLGMDNLVKVLDRMLDDKLKDTFTTTQQNF